jgi:hypothetical protein
MNQYPLMENTPGATNYAAWGVEIPTFEVFRNLTTHERLLTFCRLAILAPSTHNTQPWAFRVDDRKNSIAVYLDRSFVLPASDPLGRQAVISVGCAIEHLIIAASYFGYVYEFLPRKNLNPSSCTPLGDTKTKRYASLENIQFSENKRAPAVPQSLISSIISRRVRRAEFDPEQKVSPSTVRQLENICKSSSIKIHTITDAVRRFALAEFQAQADGYVINSPKFARELGDWLLPNTTESSRGMPGNNFGLGDSETERLHDGLRGKSTLRPEDSLGFALGGKLGIEKSPLIIVLSAAEDNPSIWLETGRIMERMFLALEESGYAVAVHAGVVEVPLVNKMFATLLGTRRKLMALFRCGKTRNPQHTFRSHSPRVPVEDLLINGEQ